jgi:hypothetical protein
MKMKGFLHRENRTDTVSKPVSCVWDVLITDLIISQLRIWH